MITKDTRTKATKLIDKNAGDTSGFNLDYRQMIGMQAIAAILALVEALDKSLESDGHEIP